MVGTSNSANHGYTARILWLDMFTIELFRFWNMSGLKLILQKYFNFSKKVNTLMKTLIYFPTEINFAVRFTYQLLWKLVLSLWPSLDDSLQISFRKYFTLLDFVILLNEVKKKVLQEKRFLLHFVSCLSVSFPVMCLAPLKKTLAV